MAKTTSKDLLNDFLIRQEVSKSAKEVILIQKPHVMSEECYQKSLKPPTEESTRTLNEIFCQAVREKNFHIAATSRKLGACLKDMELHPLALFAKENDIAALHWITKNYFHDINILSGHLSGETPVSVAAKFGQFDAFKYLVNDHGVAFNQPIRPGINNLTLLQIAAMQAIKGGDEVNQSGCIKIVKFLLNQKLIPISQLTNPHPDSIPEDKFESFKQSLQGEKFPELSESAADAHLVLDKLKISEDHEHEARAEDPSNEVKQDLSGEIADCAD